MAQQEDRKTLEIEKFTEIIKHVASHWRMLGIPEIEGASPHHGFSRIIVKSMIIGGGDQNPHDSRKNQKTEKELISLCDAVIVNDGLADIPFQVKKIVMQYGLGGEDEI